MIKVAVVGASGRMGTHLIEVLQDSEHACLSAAVTHSDSSVLGKDVGIHQGKQALGITFTDKISEAVNSAQVIVDFSLPQALENNLAAACEHEIPIVVCTTGLDDCQMDAIKTAALKAPVLYASNTSLGVTLLLNLVRTASKALGQNCDIEILEAHHTAKRDAPSGTALALGEAAAEGRGQELETVAEFNRNHSTKPYQRGRIGFASLRAGDIVGEHTVFLVTGGERLELTHRVANRKTFAEGALNAALWLTRQPVGFYAMKNVLGLDD